MVTPTASGLGNCHLLCRSILETQATPERMRQRGRALMGRVDKIRGAALYTDDRLSAGGERERRPVAAHPPLAFGHSAAGVGVGDAVGLPGEKAAEDQPGR
jgi:hypothetical protein